jgi:hypothetical protein
MQLHDDPEPAALEAFIADQWIAIVTLFTFGDVLPKPLCNYELLENLTGVPKEALLLFRESIKTLMGLRTRLLRDVMGCGNFAALRLRLLHDIHQRSGSPDDIAAALAETPGIPALSAGSRSHS